MAQSVNRALTDDQTIIGGLFMAGPEAFRSAGREPGEAAVLDFVSAQPVPVEMREHRIAFGVDPDPTGKAGILQQQGREAAFVLEVRMASGLKHPGKLTFNADPIPSGFRKGREGGKGSGRRSRPAP